MRDHRGGIVLREEKGRESWSGTSRKPKRKPTHASRSWCPFVGIAEGIDLPIGRGIQQAEPGLISVASH